MTEFHDIPFGRPWINDEDRKAVMEVLGGHILTHGPQCKSFEAEFASFLGEGACCVTVSSCTAALHLAYIQFGLGPGDEVMVPAQTHAATAHAVELVGARPVFVDCDPETGNLTADRIAIAITPRTRAVSIVHFVGIPCPMSEIMSLAERHGLKVIEDCATALGTRYRGRHVGLFGDAGAFSFYPVKHITTGEGGMFVTRHPTLAQAVGKLRAFGVDRVHTERSVPGMYDVLTLGLNYRMSEMQAALGRTQLRRIQENLDRRRTNFQVLKRALAAISGLRILDVTDQGGVSSHYCLSLVLEGERMAQRKEIVARLNAAGVGTSVYYPQPVPRMTYYRDKYGYDETQFKQAACISDCSVALPVGPHVDGKAMEYMANKIKNILSEVNP